jgi:hypothetical protein
MAISRQARATCPRTVIDWALYRYYIFQNGPQTAVMNAPMMTGGALQRSLADEWSYFHHGGGGH